MLRPTVRLTQTIMVTIIAFLVGVQSYAEPIDYFHVDGVNYDPSITTPDAFIGHGLGDKPVRHDIMVGYLRSLARQSDRINVETIGYSHEGRPILAFTVSSPENLARIDDIKTAHKERLAGGGSVQDAPVIVWLNYGVHGAESSAMDAAIPTLYHLAAGQGDDIDRTLRESVIVIIAIFNPDGHSRRINHVYTFGGKRKVTDPAHEGHNLWIEARTNHYWFDLNRDWLLLTQPESQSWIKVWHDWKPNVSADFHEMGSESTYYFHPGEPRRKNPLIPDRERELLAKIAEEHANWLDSQGELYTSEEGFDNFYIGKGSTYPSINGSIGILFEAAAARAGSIDTSNGLRTYARNIRIHFNTSLTTIAGAVNNKDDILGYQRSFFVLSERAARADNRKAFVFTAYNDLARLDRFIRLLNGHDIDVYQLAQDLTLGERTFNASESFVVPLNQAQYTMIKGIFDQVTDFEEAIFYDVSGWTLPLAYDLDIQTIDGLRFNDGLLGEPVEDFQPSIAVPGKATYGYAFSWSNSFAPRALNRFLEAGARPRVIMRPKTIVANGRQVTLEYGDIFVPANTQLDADNQLDADKLHEVTKLVAQNDHLEVLTLATGNAGAGVGDLGSTGSVRTVRQPRLLLLFDDGGTRYAAGQLWHLIDHRMEIPLTMRRKSDLGGLSLKDYTHILDPRWWA